FAAGGDRQRVRRSHEHRAHGRARCAGANSLWDNASVELGRPVAGPGGDQGLREGIDMKGYGRRRFVNMAMTAFCGAAVLIALVPLVSVFWLLLAKGFAGLSWSLFTSLPTPVGEPGGGVGNAILGTLFLVGLACVFGLPIGIGTGLFLAERGNGPIGDAVR